MPIINKFLSGVQKRNRGHFAGIVKMARSNGKINRDELRLLKRVKKELNINEIAYRRILRNPDSYAMNPPANYEERIERLHNLVKMLLVDKDSMDLSKRLLEKLAVGLGFSLDTYEAVSARAIELVEGQVDEDTFSKEIRKANGI